MMMKYQMQLNKELACISNYATEKNAVPSPFLRTPTLVLFLLLLYKFHFVFVFSPLFSENAGRSINSRMSRTILELFRHWQKCEKLCIHYAYGTR